MKVVWELFTLGALFLAAFNYAGPHLGILDSSTPQPGCHQSYAGACLDPYAFDYDCSGGGGDGPLFTGRVRVVGSDVFGLDRDGDGVGCG